MAETKKSKNTKTKNNNIKEIAVSIKAESEVNESYFLGLLWSNPIEMYGEYDKVITSDILMNDVWKFYYELGKLMYDSGVQVFDKVTIMMKVEENNLTDTFESFGGYKTIKDVIDLVGDYSENASYYYEKIEKAYTMRQMYLLFGEKVFLDIANYKWSELTSDEILSFWTDELNKVGLRKIRNYEAENLYIDADEFIRKLKEDSEEMLPFFKSKSMNIITQGVAKGHVYMFGGFGNTGKSSILAEKFVMSCVENGEKLILILNEEDAQSFRQKILLSILNHFFDKQIDRSRLINGNLTKEDENLIRLAFGKMEELMDGDESQIKVIFMERYVMSDLEKIIRFWANRGYENLAIDTHKVSDDSKHKNRWETFVEDMKTIYRLTRKNSGGCNLRTWVNFQLADSALKSRYLTYDAIGEGKASKNEASVVQMFRPMWSDEYDGGTNELRCFQKKIKHDLTGKPTYTEKEVELDKAKTYYLLFTPKNRFGKNNDNGQEVLVLEPAFHRNAFYEKGWTTVQKDFS